MQMRPQSNEYLNMQKQQPGTDSHILTKWKRLQHYKIILFCTNDSLSILFTGVYFKYFQGFCTCIPCFLSIALCLTGERLPASFWAVLVVLYSLPFPRLTNSAQSIFCQIPFSYEKKKKRARTEGPQFCKPPHLSQHEVNYPNGAKTKLHHNEKNITEERCPFLPIRHGW